MGTRRAGVLNRVRVTDYGATSAGSTLRVYSITIVPLVPHPQHWSQKRRRRPHRAGITLEPGIRPNAKTPPPTPAVRASLEARGVRARNLNGSCEAWDGTSLARTESCRRRFGAGPKKHEIASLGDWYDSEMP